MKDLIANEANNRLALVNHFAVSKARTISYKQESPTTPTPTPTPPPHPQGTASPVQPLMKMKHASMWLGEQGGLKKASD